MPLAWAVKVTELAPPATLAEAGTEMIGLLEATVTTLPPGGAGWLRLTMQVLVLPVGILLGEHCSADNRFGATSVNAVVCVDPFKEAVMVAVWVLVMVLAVAVKVAVVSPAATVTLCGTDRSALLEVRDTAVPPAGAVPLRETTQLDVPSEFREPSVHASDVSPSGALAPVVVMVEPEPVMAMPPPDAEAPATLDRFRMVPLAVAASVTDTVAAIPFWMMLELSPVARQVYNPADPAQEMALPAAVKAGPAATLMALTSDAAYAMLHCNPAGSLPDGDVSVRFRVAVPPAVVEPLERVSESLCANAPAAIPQMRGSRRM